MDIEVIRRLNLARHLYELATTSVRSGNDLHLFSAANLMQDAVESFLIAVADFVGASIDSNMHFDKYFLQINSKIAPKELPFRNKLLRLNRVRIDSKHYGIQPDRNECIRLSLVIREFFDETCASVLGASFSTVSTIDLLKDGETKEVLRHAKSALESGDVTACAIECRKALYLEVEKRFDVSEFRDKDEPSLSLFGPWTEAPYYARNKNYIEENVSEPTDFIVYDHGKIDQDLLKSGVDTTAYWNLWRLTPEVYRTRAGAWIVKHDFAKLDQDALAGRIDYVFSATLDIVLAIHRTSAATQHSESGRFTVTLSREAVPIYKKADKGSTVVDHTPAGMISIDTQYWIEGLNDDGPYWHVSHFEKGGPFLWGFIHNEDVKQ